MKKELKNRMREDISGFRLPRYEQIPDVGLYLEQTVRYVNSFLAPLGEVELTASMASNYVKHKLLPAPPEKTLLGRAACALDVHCGRETGRSIGRASTDVQHSSGKL